MQKGGDLNLIGQFGVGFYSVYLVRRGVPWLVGFGIALCIMHQHALMWMWHGFLLCAPGEHCAVLNLLLGVVSLLHSWRGLLPRVPGEEGSRARLICCLVLLHPCKLGVGFLLCLPGVQGCCASKCRAGLFSCLHACLLSCCVSTNACVLSVSTTGG